MSSKILSVKNISKCFEMYDKPIARLLQMFARKEKKYYREYWALRDVSFDVMQGECVGIIGRNGAGKSTLLQIITGTLKASSGIIEKNGRVAALLELGSGFNPEFTGIENIYMNAAILGLSKAETDNVLDEILAFADIGYFVYQPVKTYSSGMMVRLAFAVNVFVKPDLLIVDEALAVGDAAFQRKCFMRMEALKEAGTTLLFVTHDMMSVKRFCDKCVYLKDSRLCEYGDSVSVVTRYMQDLFPQSKENVSNENNRPETIVLDNIFHCRPTPSFSDKYGAGGATVSEIRIYGLNSPNILPKDGTIRIEIDIMWDKEKVLDILQKEAVAQNIYAGFCIVNKSNVRYFGGDTDTYKLPIDPNSEKTSRTISFEVDIPTLAEGEYFLSTAVSLGTPSLPVHLIWDDFSVQLFSPHHIHGGFIHPKTICKVW